MKTKRFLLATSGATVDGRTIDEKMLTEMASSYDPKTYGARLNIEHIRGLGSDGPFRAYGDVLSLETEEVTVNFNGQDEKRTGLFGIFDVTEDAKKLNGAGQKLYPSIEIEPNFAGKGFAYLMGCALTDSPASIATDRLQFNRQLPGALTVSADKPAQAFAMEFAEDDGKSTEAGDSFLGKLGGMLDSFASRFAPKTEVTPPAPKEGEGEPAEFDFAQLKPLFTDLTQAFATEVGALRTALADQSDQFAVKIKAIEDRFEVTPAASYAARPAAAGAHGDATMTDC